MIYNFEHIRCCFFYSVGNCDASVKYSDEEFFRLIFYVGNVVIRNMKNVERIFILCFDYGDWKNPLVVDRDLKREKEKRDRGTRNE